ncbi:MAG: SecD/SecF fusion protein [Gaiellales bacterium]|nr:SecD/SecF fusion protein [Gaiellales bacterium]
MNTDIGKLWASTRPSSKLLYQVSEKKKNWAILGVVAALMIGCAMLAVVRDFRLGLDLRGGLEVVLDARPAPGEKVTPEALSQSADILSKRIDPQGTLSPEIRTSENPAQITVSVPGIKDPAAAAGLLVSSGQLQSFDLFKYLSNASKGQGQFSAVPTITLYELLNDPQVKAKVRADGVGSWALFDAAKKQLGKVEPQKQQVLEDYNPQNPVQPLDSKFLAIPKGTEVVSCLATNFCPGGNNLQGTYYYLFDLSQDERGNPDVITGDQVSAKADTDPQTGEAVVSLTYKKGGAEEFTDITREMVGTAVRNGIQGGLPNAIVVDGQLVASPTVDPARNPGGIDATISGGSQIDGVSRSEAERIALEVQSGSLPLKFTATSFNNVSATLGKDSLRNGLIAGAAGLLFVMVFLVVLYGFLGLIADIALIIYGVLLAGVVLALPVTMTLPGIAGTILTIGVAADANIVIFERIKEEVRAGKSIRAAIATGYKRGFSTIIDANVVTLITAVVLILVATSSVKGFAVMLLIGVITSIVTAVVATRAMLSLLAGFKFMTSPKVLGQIGTGDRWQRFDFIGRAKWWFAFSAILIVASGVSLATKQLNQGIDFTGGSQFSFTLPSPHSTGEVQDAFSKAGIDNPVVQGLGQSVGGGYTEFQVKSHALEGQQQNVVITDLSKDFGIAPNTINTKNVSSSFGQSVLDQAYLAIAASLLIIFVYVSFRFEWRYSVPVMVALGHDIIITLGVYSLAQREVTADTVAAVLTVLGYSLYDTVIVFDRVRENIPILRKMTASRVVNESLAETVTRSLNTSIVTLIPVTLLFIFGSGSLTDFAFALIVGIVCGAYSSIFIAAPVLAMLLEREPQFVRRRAELEGTVVEPVRGRAVAVGTAPQELPQPAVEGPAPSPRRKRRARPHGRAR